MAQFYGTNAHDVIVGGAEADEIYGEGGNDILSGGDEDDYIVGGLGNDELHGDAGNDLLFGDYQSRSAGGHDRIYGGDGNDIAYGGGGHDVIEGGAGDDFLVGDDGDDFLIGGDGDDILRGGTGIDTYDGGAQSSGNSALNPGVGDRVSFFDLRATQGVIADLRTGIISNDGFGNVETMTGIEALGGGTAFADAFYGNDERNFFLGARGDTLVGFGGDDYFQLSGGAAALIDGGAGRDYLLLSSSGSYEPDRTGDGVADQVPAMTIGYTVDLAAGTITDGHGHSGTIVSIEMIGATELDDVLLGSDADEWFSPGQGSDRVDGRGGTDTVSYARDQYDYYYGLAGGVFIDLAAGVAIETRAEPDFVDNTNSDDIVSAPTGTAGPGSEAKSTDLLAGIENVVGSGLGDTIYGDDGDNRIAPGAGNDIVDGRGGSDTIDYSAARAPVEVRLDQGRTYEQGTGKLRLELTPNNSIFGTLVWADDHSASVDQFTGIENAVGSAFDDILVGDGGSNRLEGGGGNDRIDGGAGADSMLGGTGNDIYFVDQNGDMVLEDAGEGIDEVRTALGSRSDFAAMYILPANVENLTGTSATGQGVYGNALD
ncbi:MAG TPA: calcium-binding protein, partial [Allosphingosinicella sp.]|nr:calcium-binding protein [Allosphingosinicella sp.]